MHVGLNGFDIDDLIQYLDGQGIEKCWLLSWEELNPAIAHIYQHLGIDQILEAYERFPDRIVPFYAPDPSDKKFEEKLHAAIGKGIKGCGELKVSFRWEDKAIGDYLKVVEKTGLPLLFHMEVPRIQYLPNNKGIISRISERLLNDKYNGVPGYYLNRAIDSSSFFKRKADAHRVPFPGYLFDFEYLERRVQEFPGINFIGHGPEFWNAISASKNPGQIHQKGKIAKFGVIDRLLETYDNLYCDISGHSGYNAITRDRNAGEIFLNKHVDKILFGTDNTKLNLLEYLSSLNISEQGMQKILHLNSEKLVPE